MSDTQDEIRELRKKTASLRLSLDRMTTAHSEAKAKLATARKDVGEEWKIYVEELEAKLAVTEKALLMASGYASANPQDAYDNFISEATKDD